MNISPKIILLFLLTILSCSCGRSQIAEVTQSGVEKKAVSDSTDLEQPISVGASRFDDYIHLLEEKSVGLVVNQTSVVNETHLVDTLISLGINIKRIFAPEHGFRGVADAGEVVKNGKDIQTGLPIISLYGKNKKPSQIQIADLDVVIFDIQDVGARFYTYISTMHYVMEACAENEKKFIVLDRPNPNGHYIDGPVLEAKHKSFVGMHSIPIVHGCTVGELAKMINGEKWLKDRVTVDLVVVPCLNYNHQKPYSLPIKPSPNLPNDLAIRLYPSLCLFEGTIVSAGRGTNMQFQIAGHPAYPDTSFSFTPQRMEGAKYPKFRGQKCYGINYQSPPLPDSTGFSLAPIIQFYEKYPENLRKSQPFFNNFFTNLAGTQSLKKQIEQGMGEEAIKATWQDDLKNYKAMREKYLIYE